MALGLPPNSSFQIVSRESIFAGAPHFLHTPPVLEERPYPSACGACWDADPSPRISVLFRGGRLSHPALARISVAFRVCQNALRTAVAATEDSASETHSGGQRHTERCGLHQLPIGTRAAQDDDAATCRGKLREGDAGRRFHARDCLLTADASQATRRRCKKKWARRRITAACPMTKRTIEGDEGGSSGPLMRR